MKQRGTRGFRIDIIIPFMKHALPGVSYKNAGAMLIPNIDKYLRVDAEVHARYIVRIQPIREVTDELTRWRPDGMSVAAISYLTDIERRWLLARKYVFFTATFSFHPCYLLPRNTVSVVHAGGS